MLLLSCLALRVVVDSDMNTSLVSRLFWKPVPTQKDPDLHVAISSKPPVFNDTRTVLCVFDGPFEDRAFVIGLSTVSSFLRCTPDNSQAFFDFRILCVFFIIAYAILTICYAIFSRTTHFGALSLVKGSVKEQRDYRICYHGHTCILEGNVQRNIVDDWHVETNLTIECYDEAQDRMYYLHDDDREHSQRMQFKESGDVEFTCPVAVGDYNMNVKMRKKEGLRMPRNMLMSDAVTHLFLQVMECGLVCEYDFDQMCEFMQWTREVYDLSALCLFMESGGHYQAVSECYAPNEHLQIPDELLQKVVSCSQGLVETQYNGSLLIITPTTYSQKIMVCVMAFRQDAVVLRHLEDYFHKFCAILISFWFVVMSRIESEDLYINYMSMIQSSHAFTVSEYVKDMNHKKTTIGALDIDCGITDPLDRKFLDLMSVEQRLQLMHSLKKLEQEGKSFTQLSFKATLPNGTVKWYALSGQSRYDESFDCNILYFLCEDISHLRNVEAQIQETAHDLALASRLLGLHKYVVAEDNTVKVEGTDLYHELGYKTDGGKIDVLSLIHEDDVEKFKNLEETKRITVRLKDANDVGNYQWYTVVCTSKKGGTRGLMFSVQELTQLQSSVKSTRDCFQIGSATNAFAFWALNLDPNEAPHAVFETKPFRYLIRLCHPDDAKKLSTSELRDLRTAKVVEIQLRMNYKMPYEWFSVTFLPSGGKQILCFAFNIDARKKTHDLLRETQQLLDMAFTYSDVRMWSFEDTHKNSRAVLTLDSQQAEEVVMDWGTLEHNLVPEYQEIVTEAFKKALSGNEKLEIEVPFFFDNLHWLLLRGILVDENNERRLTGIYVDLTDIKEAAHLLECQKAAAEEASMAKSMFLANMSHEIRTPLNGICGLLEIIQSSDLTKEQIELTNCIQSSFMELLELLNDTLDLAKLESHKLIPLSVKFDPCEVLAGAQETRFSRKRNPNIRFHIITSPNEPLLYRGDPHCFLRLLTNLLSNALKFTTEGSIDIKIWCEDDSKLAVSVTDTGIGMTDAILQGIQDHFDHGETMEVYEKTCVGVGLSLVTEMIRFMNGAISVTSKLGSGTCFKISLPFEPLYYPYMPPGMKKPIKALVCGRDKVTDSLTEDFAKWTGFDVSFIDSLANLRPDSCTLLLIQCDDSNTILSEIRTCFAKGIFDKMIVGVLATTIPEELKSRVELFQTPLKPNLLRTYLVNIMRGKIADVAYFRTVCTSVPDNLSLHILAVDDNATNQLVMKKMLKKLGCSFVVVSNGQEAVDAVQKEKFDLVIMDQFMPVLDGPEATRIIRQLPSDVSRIPVIAMTASIMQEDEEACKRAGMNAFLCKPVTLKNLAKVIGEVMGINPQ